MITHDIKLDRLHRSQIHNLQFLRLIQPVRFQRFRQLRDPGFGLVGRGVVVSGEVLDGLPQRREGESVN